MDALLNSGISSAESGAAAKYGRRFTAEQIRKLFIKLARENPWGYARVVGELRKLRIRSVSKSTVRNILKEHGLDPCPERSGTTWDEFISQHAASLWQADFLSQKILSRPGASSSLQPRDASDWIGRQSNGTARAE